MTEPPKPPSPELNLAEAIRRRFAPLGGVDALEIPPRTPARAASWQSLDQTLADIRSRFADLPPEELEAIIGEAIAAARKANVPGASAINASDMREQWDARLDQVEQGADFVITREGKPIARLIPLHHGETS